MKNKKIIFAILAFIIIETASFFYMEYLHKKEITNYLAEKTTETEIKLNAVRGSYKIMIKTLFKQIINKPQVIELYSRALDADSIRKNEIRDSLYNLLSPTYEELKVANIRQFIFIMPNNETFLRFHRPQKYGDDLTDVRYSVKMANQTKQIYTGFEEGRSYNGFRNIFPIYYNDKHIGVIEISFSFAINILFKQDDDVFNLMINKDIANLKLNESQRENYVQSLLSDEYLHEKEFLHYKNDTTNILKEIDENIKTEITDRLANNENFTILHRINKADYLITFISVKNVEGNPVAYMTSYHKDTNIIAVYHKQYILKHIVGFIIYAVLVFAFLLFLFKKQKLREKEIQEQKILETFKEGIYIVSPDYNISYANSALQKKIGKNIVGQKCYKVVYNFDEKCSWCIYENLKKEKNTVDYEFEAEDNKTLISNNILLNDNSKLTILTDITEKKKNEHELKKLSEAVEQSANIVVITDINGNIEYVNHRFTELTGYTAQEVIGKNPHILSAGTQKKKYYQDLWNTITAGKTWKGEFYNKKKNGDFFWEKATVTSLKNDKGEIINYLAIKEDYTERKKAEQALKESEAQLRQIIDLVPHFIFVKDETGKFEIVNKATAEVFGTTVKDLTGRRDSEFVATEEEMEDFRADDIEVINSGKTKFIPEEPITDSENNIRYLQTTKVPFKIKGTGKPALLGIAIDITARKKAEQEINKQNKQLKELNVTKDKFFSIIAHDLKSPFNAILGFSDILMTNHKQYDDEKRDMMIKAVNNSANSAFQLLENLLTWSHSQSGRISFAPEKLHLKILLFESMSNLQEVANKKNIQVLDTVSENEIIFADKNMIATVIRNLISNAIKFTHSGGNIIISSQKQNDFVEISVTDSGIGIPNDTIDELFRIDKNTSTKGTENETGTGLGLILCKEFVEKHGGEIWVESKEGKGSTFSFTIPKTN